MRTKTRIVKQLIQYSWNVTIWDSIVSKSTTISLTRNLWLKNLHSKKRIIVDESTLLIYMIPFGLSLDELVNRLQQTVEEFQSVFWEITETESWFSHAVGGSCNGQFRNVFTKSNSYSIRFYPFGQCDCCPIYQIIMLSRNSDSM